MFDTQSGYFVQPVACGGESNLQAITLSSGAVTWTFTGERAVCSTLVVSQYVIAEGCSGRLYGLDATNGQQVWLADPGAPPIWNFTAQLPLRGMAAGDGLLVAPVGTRLIAHTLATNP